MGHFTAEGLKQLRKRASKLGQKKPSLCEPVFEAWADFFIDLIPLWVAPSLITFIGLLCLFSGYAAFYFVQMTRDNQADFGTEPPPQWACFFAAGTFLAYTTFNSLDEKQADRTGSGSALSDIFNIACDAIAMCLVTISISSVTMLGISTETIVLFCIIEFSYYISHWRHYHCGTGADSIITIQEGLAAVMAMCLVSAFIPMIWKNDMSWLVAPFKEFPACPEEGCFQPDDLEERHELAGCTFQRVPCLSRGRMLSAEPLDGVRSVRLFNLPQCDGDPRSAHQVQRRRGRILLQRLAAAAARIPLLWLHHCLGHQLTNPAVRPAPALALPRHWARARQPLCSSGDVQHVKAAIQHLSLYGHSTAALYHPLRHWLLRHRSGQEQRRRDLSCLVLCYGGLELL